MLNMMANFNVQKVILLKYFLKIMGVAQEPWNQY